MDQTQSNSQHPSFQFHIQQWFWNAHRAVKPVACDPSLSQQKLPEGGHSNFAVEWKEKSTELPNLLQFERL
jgi:hypothetical protein